MLLTTTEITVAKAIEEFLIDRRLRNLSPESIEWCRKCLRRERLLAFSPAVQREMLRYLRIRGSLLGEEGPLFPSRKGAGRIVVGYAAQAGINDVKVTPHGFRMQYVSAFLKGGGSIVHLQQILGHADITMSRRYASVFDADCFEVSMNLSPVAGMRIGLGEENPWSASRFDCREAHSTTGAPPAEPRCSADTTPPATAASCTPMSLLVGQDPNVDCATHDDFLGRG